MKKIESLMERTVELRRKKNEELQHLFTQLETLFQTIEALERQQVALDRCELRFDFVFELCHLRSLCHGLQLVLTQRCCLLILEKIC